MGQLFALGLQELDKTISTHCLIISEVAEDTEKIVFVFKMQYLQIIEWHVVSVSSENPKAAKVDNSSVTISCCRVM